MMNLEQIYIERLQETASHLSISASHSFIPALIIGLSLASVFSFVYLRIQIRNLALLNLGLVASIVTLFQGCAGGAGSNTPPPSASPVNPTLPPQGNDLEGYFLGEGQTPNQPIPRTAVFSPKKNAQMNLNSTVWPSTELISSLDVASNLKSASLVPDLLQYKVLSGNSNQFVSTGAFVSDLATANSLVNTCESQSNGRWVLDLKIKTASTLTPLIRVAHGQPFLVLLACVSDTGGIQVIDPKLLQYDILSDSSNFFSSVSSVPDEAGWFTGSFNSLENNSISSKTTTIRATALLAAENSSTNGLTIPNAPSVRVVVYPESYNARMTELNMMTFLTDNKQEMLRGSARSAESGGFVNPSSGELIVDQVDLVYPTLDTSLGLSVSRSYRSFNARVGDFGWNWDLNLPSREYYTFASPTGDRGFYEFLRSGDGRIFYTGRTIQTNAQGTNTNRIFDIGPFWDSQDSLRPNWEASKYFRGLENSSFDLNGRLLRFYDKGTGNAVYYLRDGSGLAMTMDQIGARNTGENIRGIIQAFQNFALDANGVAADVPALVGAKQDALRNALLTTSGNFVYYARNKKGYIQAVVDKTGNFIYYTYDKSGAGDLLKTVTRYVSHDPMGTGSLQAGALQLYSYKYAPSSFGNSWTGLLSEVSTYARPKVIQGVTYARDPQLYGEAPVVTQYQVGPMSYGFSYIFKNPRLTTDPSRTAVIDGMGRTFEYTFDSRGFHIQTEGPTETSESSILYQGVWDPRNFRRVQTVVRGASSFSFFDTKGNPLKVETCPTLKADGSSNPVPFATLSASGVFTGLGCPQTGGGRTISFDAQSGYYQRDWFMDLTANVQPLRTILPTMVSGSTQTITLSKNNCVGGPGYTDSNAKRKSGSWCEYNSSNRGGTIPKIRAEATFDDGSTRFQLDPHLPTSTTGAIGDFGTDLRTLAPLAYIGGDQTGFYNSMPASGMSRRYDPGVGAMRTFDTVSSSGQTTCSETGSQIGCGISIFDPYGNRLAAKHPWGAKTLNYYDYRGPIATLVAKNLRYPGGLAFPQTPNSFKTWNDMQQTYDPLGDSYDRLRSEIAVLGLGEQLKKYQYPVDLELDGRLRPLIVYGDGEKRELSYGVTNWLGGTCTSQDLLCMETISRQKSASASAGTLVTYKNYKYDSFERLTATRNEDGTVVTIDYRADNDFGPYIVFNNQNVNPINAGTSSTEILQYDAQGRPTCLQKLFNIPNSQIKNQIVTTKFNGFGEVVEQRSYYGVSDTETNCQAPTSDYLSINQNVYDWNTGVLLSTSTQQTKPSDSSGQDIDSETYQTTYSDFDEFLSPRKITDENRKLVTSMTGVPGKLWSVQVDGPVRYRDLSSGVKTYSLKTVSSDGCGNPIVTTTSTGTGSNISTTNSIEDRLCKVVESVDSRGWKSQFEYSQSGDLIGSGDVDNSPTNVVGHERSAIYAWSVKFCKPDSYNTYLWPLFSMDSSRNGRCVGIPTIYNIEVTGGPGPDERLRINSNGVSSLSLNPQEWPFIMHQAQSNWSSNFGAYETLDFTGSGKNLVTYRVVDSLFRSTQIRPRLDSASDSNQILTNELQSGGVLVSSHTSGSQSKTYQDLGLGVQTKSFNNYVDPSGPRQYASVQNTIDSLGRTISTSTYVSSNPIAESTTPAAQFLKVQSSVLSREKGQPKLVQNLQKISVAGILVDSTQTSEVIGFDGELPRSTKLTVGGPFLNGEGLKTTDYDGAGIPIYQTYAQTPSTNLETIKLVSKQTLNRDQANRITQESVRLDESVVSGQSSNLGLGLNNSPVNRLILGSSPSNTDLNIDYEYTTEGFIMRYDGFSVEYKLGRGDGEQGGSIREIRVISPDEPSLVHLFSATGFSNGLIADAVIGNNRLEMPYPAHMDYKSGALSANLPTGYSWLDGLQNLFSTLAAGIGLGTNTPYLLNRDLAKYKFINGDEDQMFRDNGLILSATDAGKVTATHPRYDGHYQSLGTLGYNRPGANASYTRQIPGALVAGFAWDSDNVTFNKTFFSRTQQSNWSPQGGEVPSDEMPRALSTRFRSCDNLIASTNDTNDFSNSIIQLQDTQGQDGAVYYNEMGKVARAWRTHYYKKGTPDERKWKLEARHAYDLKGQIAASEELAYYRNARGVFNNSSDPNRLFLTRALLSRKWNSYFPYPAAIAGVSAPTLREAIQDSQFNINETGYCSVFPDGMGSSPASDACQNRRTFNKTGIWYYIYGSTGSPVMAFRKETSSGAYCTTSDSNCRYTRYNYIYDALGNVIHFYRHRNYYPTIPVPGEKEFYYPFGSSTTISYKNPIAHTTVDPVTQIHFVDSINTSSDPTDPALSRYSFDPEIQPLSSSFGFMGNRRDVVGFTYDKISGEAYDPYTGVIVNPQEVTDNICQSKTNMAMQAYGTLQAQRNGLASIWDSLVIHPLSFSPSAAKNERVADEFLKWDKNNPSDAREDSIANRLHMLKFFKDRSATNVLFSWTGYSGYPAYLATEFCGVGQMMDGWASDNKLAFGFGTANLALCFTGAALASAKVANIGGLRGGVALSEAAGAVNISPAISVADSILGVGTMFDPGMDEDYGE